MPRVVRRRKAPKRKGVPFTVYFGEETWKGIENVSGKRQVPKSTIVRYAVERLLEQMANGQMELPLGL